MARIDTWDQFLSNINQFTGAPRPLDSLKQAGFTLGGVVGQALSKATPPHVVDPAVVDRLKSKFGPSPPVRVHVGRAAKRVAFRRAGHFSASATINFAAFNEVLAELWRVNTFPQHVSPSDVTRAITIADLRTLCDGVPSGPDSDIRGLDVTAPPVLSPAADSGHIQMDLRFRLLAGPAQSPAALAGVMRARIPFALEVTTDPDTKRDIIALTIDGTQQAEVKIDVDPASVIKPHSAASQATLEGRLQNVLRLVLLVKRFQLSAPAETDITGTFSRTRLAPAQVGAAARRSGASAFLTVGVNMVSDPAANPAALVNEAVPSPPANFRIAIDEKFMEDTIAAMIASGDLAKAINDKVRSAVSPLSFPTIRVDGSNVTLGNGSMTVELDCTIVDACAFGKDLAFAARVTGRPQVFEGRMTLDASSVDIDLDNTDAILCTILGALTGPFGLIFTVAALIILASISPAVPNPDLPVAVDPLLPGSEQLVHLELLQVTASDGTLFANGQSRLAPDTEHTFVYLRVVTAPSPGVTAPVRGAKVQLLELDNPAPAGDDTVIPETHDTERRVGRKIVSDTTTYAPFKDTDLGVQITDETGLVRFAVKVTQGAGLLTHIHTEEDVSTGKLLSSHTDNRLISGDKPDFGVTIVSATGQVLATRRLVALNVAGDHAGTREAPIPVVVKDALVAHPLAGAAAPV